MRSALLVLAVISLAASAVQADTPSVFKAPTTPEQRLRIAGKIHEIETTPLSDDAKKARTAIFQWIVESPDIHLKWCAGLLLDMPKNETTRWGGLLVQAILSAGAFAIENPAEEKNALLVARAGVRGALQAYRATLAVHSQPPSGFFDGLVAADAAGKLDDYIAPKLTSCESLVPIFYPVTNEQHAIEIAVFDRRARPKPRRWLEIETVFTPRLRQSARDRGFGVPILRNLLGTLGIQRVETVIGRRLPKSRGSFPYSRPDSGGRCMNTAAIPRPTLRFDEIRLRPAEIARSGRLART